MGCSTDVNFIASQALARGQGQKKPAEQEGSEKRDAMEALEGEAKAPAGFVAASTGPQAGSVRKVEELTVPPALVNPDAIDLDAMEE